MDLSIVVLNYNTRDLLKQTLKSIKSKLQTEIIVVDNASTDGSVEMVKKFFPKIKLIGAKKNLGFAAGNNLGIKKARGKYVLLLNSDTIVPPKALDKMVNYLDLHLQVGAVTPKLVLEDGSIDPACHRGLPTLWNSITYFTGLEKIFPKFKLFGGYHMTWLDEQTTHQVEACSMAAMMIRKTVIDEIGLLNQEFFMYAEDLEYCKRINQAGWQIIYLSDVSITHLKGKSGTESNDFQVQKTTRKHFYQTMKQYMRSQYQDRYPEWSLRLIEQAIDLLARIRG